MSYRKYFCCCGCGDGREILNESGGSADSRGVNSGNGSGNPRNKCVLKPGHSHMDWVRLSNSKDLTGLGERAGKLEVTLEELARHNKISDGWLAINGKVFNVTSYVPYHPGGVEELKKGLGIDATKLFYEVHNWVNSDSLLKSCYVGRLITSPLQDILVSNPQNGTEQPTGQAENPPTPGPPPSPAAERKPANEPINIDRPVQENYQLRGCKMELPPLQPFGSTHDDPIKEVTTTGLGVTSEYPPNKPLSTPAISWTQTLHMICIGFQIKPFSNPSVEARKFGRTVQCALWYDNKLVINNVYFDWDVMWPGEIRLIEEDGKVELSFEKAVDELWKTYGVTTQQTKEANFLADTRVDYSVVSKEEIASNIFLMELQRRDGVMISVPVGHHMRVFTGHGDEDLSKSYTPIPKPEKLFPITRKSHFWSDKIILMVKRYENGNVSKHICDAEVGTALQLLRPISPGFVLTRIYHRERFLCLAAGTGLTPMLSLMLCILQRKIRMCKRMGMLLCNSKKENIPFFDGFQELLRHSRNTGNRFSLKHILTDPEMPRESNFIKGPLSVQHVRNSINEIHSPLTEISEEFFVFVCGPPSFNDSCRGFLEELQVPEDQIFVFQG